MFYTTFGAFQKKLKAYYERTGNQLTFPEMMVYMEQHHMLSETRPDFIVPEQFEDLSDEEFDQLVDSIPLVWSDSVYQPAQHVVEDDLIPLNRDVFLIRHPRYTRPFTHSHNYFEIDYVIKGTMTFVFEKEPIRELHPGELVIIAPNSRHDMYTTSDDTIACIICIRKSTFNTTFFQQMSGQDLLAYFFRTILHDDGHPNYLMFYTNNNRKLIRNLRHAVIECTRTDSYSNNAVINLMQLIFIELLRGYSQTIRFYNYEMGSDFSLVLQYIQHNYQHITLSSLAEFFHYSEPHLCTMIRKNTGYTFSDLIRQLRLSDATKLLCNTDMKIQEIAETVGYNSADHFSRVFRTTYKMSPADYRKKNRKAPDFIPFKTE